MYRTLELKFERDLWDNPEHNGSARCKKETEDLTKN
jgi:hypothetical protein